MFQLHETARLEPLRAAFPEAEVEIEHTGGGCLWLAVRFGEGADYYVLTNGEADLPDEGEGYRYLGLHSDEDESPHYEGTPLLEESWESNGFTEADAVEAIRRHREERS